MDVWTRETDAASRDAGRSPDFRINPPDTFPGSLPVALSFVSGYGGGSVSESKPKDFSPNFPILPSRAFASYGHLHIT
ncbi:MAG: hypothetical protein RL318_887 [Fibrobacterota bacterium]|jgi:hypothetical protein